MSLGVVMIVHEALHRATQLARHWADHGCPVVLHVDQNVDQDSYSRFVDSVSDYKNILFCDRRHCEWGTWSLVEASQAASEMMLDCFPEVQHVLLASGSCLPLRPIAEMTAYLSDRPTTDFIESVTTEDVPWAIGGLNEERFTLRFPFSWRRHRRLFDWAVGLQRRLGYRRRIPLGVTPHLGSQWWCLTRHTLSAILTDPRRVVNDAYFSKVWIPDESYYQTLSRQHSQKIESRSLTLSKFDFQGKPHVFYDDHMQLLRRSDCFVARKIWPQADRLFNSFLSASPSLSAEAEPNPGKIDRIFSKATLRRTKGRSGLLMQSRFPHQRWGSRVTAEPYVVLEGYTELFRNFEPWLADFSRTRVHGHLFATDRAHFEGGETEYFGALPSSAALRDYDTSAFLTNLIWNTQGERQCFQFGPADTQDITWNIARDDNARIHVITGAWAVPLFLSKGAFAEIRREAARLQKIECEHLRVLRSDHARARIRIQTLSEFVLNPLQPLQEVVDQLAPRDRPQLTSPPEMVHLGGFGDFLQNLKNQGMHPHLVGDFPTDFSPQRATPYLVPK
ncbi:Core-2/I-Branching enzyme [Aliiroseovarius halocynthiae]|uniref:Peptide O-xylosyltransferase n=1 Tax=Aliiroseovarius halocynthiae TaxID=985055 RepID=A0A545SNT4_9RHOB|nr:beta-1,6-N-acetylglucosaminyltransferase [Aliiroseovarius halocynthiae]TQV66642.1 beta-1,6-N-acetylglucosaminyltransferase [Aliiroseovarius halocynthiae]SMR82482.1 Core-2/I-Branching enzyme [Aliiroseovarius halocynthiae]